MLRTVDEKVKVKLLTSSAPGRYAFARQGGGPRLPTRNVHPPPHGEGVENGAIAIGSVHDFGDLDGTHRARTLYTPPAHDWTAEGAIRRGMRRVGGATRS